MNHRGTETQREHTGEIPSHLNLVSGQIVDAAYAVHRALGPGLLESVYETCLAYELKKRGLAVERQVELPVVYKDVHLNAGFRLDLLVEASVVVELKTVDVILPVHLAQVLTYLKLSGHRLGLLVNFNVPSIKKGIHRLAL
jgi:GxxExxY protein